MPRANAYDTLAGADIDTDDDELLIWDTSAGAVKNITVDGLATALSTNANPDILKASDIGTTVQGYDAGLDLLSGYNFTTNVGLLDALESVVTPSQITSSQNNYSPTGLSTATVLRLSTDDERSITGLAAQTSGRRLTIQNVGSFAITLSDESASSTAANRFAWPYDIAVVLAPQESIAIRYDGTLSRWVACFVSPVQVHDVSASAGAMNYKYTLGEDGTTSFPDFAVAGNYDQTKVLAKSILMGDPGDTPELAGLIVNGTASSPTHWTGYYPGWFAYGWSYDNTGSFNADGTVGGGDSTYLGRNAQITFAQVSTPTQTSREGQLEFGVTKTGEQAPWTYLVVTPTHGNLLHIGRLAYLDAGLTYPVDLSALPLAKQYCPGFDVSTAKTYAVGQYTALASDIANNFAFAALKSTSLTNGFLWGMEHSSNDWVMKSRVAGSDSETFRIPLNTNRRAQLNRDLYVVGTGNFSTGRFELTDTSASAGPLSDLVRLSPSSAAANDVLGARRYIGNDSANNEETYAEVDAQIVSPTSTTESGRIRLRTVTSGTLGTAAYVGAGIYTASMSDPGADSIAATNVFVGATPCRMRQVAFTLNDDAATSYALRASSSGIIILTANNRTWSAIGAFDIIGTNAIDPLGEGTSGANIAWTTGALAGTTGTDGNLTISISSGNLYIENRAGGALVFRMIIID